MIAETPRARHHHAFTPHQNECGATPPFCYPAVRRRTPYQDPGLFELPREFLFNQTVACVGGQAILMWDSARPEFSDALLVASALSIATPEVWILALQLETLCTAVVLEPDLSNFWYTHLKSRCTQLRSSRIELLDVRVCQS